MIQQAFITQWRERVPWANDAQVEQDLVVSRALVEIFSEIGLRAGLAFRGGTALNKLHLDSPQRYSEDIDLVQISPGPIGNLINPIQHRLRSLLGTPSVSVRERAARLLYCFDSETQPIVPLRLKIEIDTRDHDPVLELVHRSFEVRSGWFQGKAELPTYHLDELMGTKLRSLYQRRKGRDLFDHWLVLENGLVDPDQVVACFLAYLKRQRLSVSRAQFEENLHAKMQNRSFLADAQPLLRPATQFDPHAAFQLVLTRLVSRIPGEPWKGRKEGAPPAPDGIRTRTPPMRHPPDTSSLVSKEPCMAVGRWIFRSTWKAPQQRPGELRNGATPPGTMARHMGAPREEGRWGPEAHALHALRRHPWRSIPNGRRRIMKTTRWKAMPLAKVMTLTLLVPLAFSGCADQDTLVTPEVDPSLSLSGEGLNVIVLLDPASAPGRGAANRAAAADVAAAFGITPRHTYGTAVFGFVATVPPAAVQALTRNPRVLSVEPERLRERAIEFDGPAAQSSSQVLPTGINRIEVDRNPYVSTDGSGRIVDADIAILDGGIDPSHPDLNVAGGQNFVGGARNKWDVADDHGTHVAGTVAAMDNGFGVVGVAPGARVWSVRVCGPRWCTDGDIIGGIDWVAEEKASGRVNFAAANFSITSDDSDNDCLSPANATHAAICGLADTGVPFVMAAGNNGRLKVPYPVAFAVSALRDLDGMAGGQGGWGDDELAGWSNYGEKVHIAAPGYSILSTIPGGYGTMSGTSMAAPHVAGAVALYLHAKGLEPASNAVGVEAIKAAIIGAALPQGTTEENPCSYDDSRIGGPLLFANALALGGNGTCVVAGSDPPPVEEFGSISGTVKEAESGDAIAGATVTVGNTGLSGTTGQDGIYFIDNVPVGTYSLTASAEGYESETKSAVVVEDQVTNVDFSLNEEEIVEPPPGDTPVASFTYSCKNTDTCAFTDTSTGSVVEWLWTFAKEEGTTDPDTSTEPNPTYTFPEEATYSVTLIVRDGDARESTPASATLTCTTRGQLRCR